MRWPSKDLCRSSAFERLVRPSRFLGMTKKCTGATGAMSLNAKQRSSWYIMLAGICPETILSKIVISSSTAVYAFTYSVIFNIINMNKKIESLKDLNYKS